MFIRVVYGDAVHPSASCARSALSPKGLRSCGLLKLLNEEQIIAMQIYADCTLQWEEISSINSTQCN